MSRKSVRNRILTRLEQALDARLDAEGLPDNINDIEALALRLRQELGQIAAEELTAEAATRVEGQEAPKQACSCGRTARCKGLRDRQLVSLAGEWLVRRRYYYCRRCDHGFCPVDRGLGVGGSSFTDRLQQEYVRLAALLPFAHASDVLRELAGASVSAKHGQRLLLDCQSRLDSFEAVRSSLPQLSGSGSDVLYLSADGVFAPIDNGYREVKVGACWRGDNEADDAAPVTYTSDVGDASVFGIAWSALAERFGWDDARLRVVVADGANWIWNQAALHFPGTIQILDFFHAVERLYAIGRAAFGDVSERGRVWCAEARTLLWDGEHSKLRRAIKQIAAQHETAATVAAETLGYYANNIERMDYPRYRAMGLKIGSGRIEATCKWVVSQRIKGAGMRWSEAGVQAVARLRCLLLGNEWAAFCQYWHRAQVAA